MKDYKINFSDICTFSELQLQEDLSDVLNHENLGITTLDIGILDEKSKSWYALNRYCTQEVESIHHLVSRSFQNLLEKEPINYLIDHYKDEVNNINSDVLTHKFKVSNDILRKYQEKQNTFILKITTEKFVNTDNNYDLELEKFLEIRNYYENIKLATTAFERFCVTQQYFTDFVALKYNDVYQSPAVKYATIVLFSFEDTIRERVFTHNAAVFSNNDDYLKKDITKILFQYITKSKYISALEKLHDLSVYHSKKSAKAAIMSRNMSHNLGSHVMAYLKLKLNSVEDIIRKNVLHRLPILDIDNIHECVEFFKEEKNIKEIELPFLVGLGRFINYLQERQDYIATVATNHIPYNATVSFKDFIYDELKPELRTKRHDKENTKGRLADNILLDYIAYSEKYDGSSSISLLFGDFDGYTPEEDTKAFMDFERLRNLEVAMPGGITGRQAFFSIVENIIRNGAKHSFKENIMRIVLDVVNDIPDFWSSFEEEEIKNKYIAYKDEYHIITITNKLRNNADSIGQLKKGIKDPYIDHSTQEMKGEFKGIKEMRISAAWLRNYYIDTIIEEDQPPALHVRGVDYNESRSTCAIQYLICLPKPKKLALVFEDVNKQLRDIYREYKPNGNEYINHADITKLKKDFREYGFGLFSYEEFKNKNANYELVVVENTKDKILFNQVRSLSPSRILECELNEMLQPLEKKLENLLVLKKGEYDYDKVESKSYVGYFYEKWINNNFFNDANEGHIKPQLVVLDDKTYQHNKENNANTIEKLNIVVSVTGDQNKVLYPGNIIYSSHYEGVMRELVKTQDPNTCMEVLEARFIEGITGNNSTDRLIRRNEWDDEWYYKQIAAGMSKVAIFDERLFEYASQKNTKSFIKSEDLIENDFNKDNISYEIIKNRLKELGLDDVEEDILTAIDFFSDGEYSLSDLKYKIEEILDPVNRDRVRDTYYIERLHSYYEKGIWFFDLDFIDKKISIIGFNKKMDRKNLNYDSNDKIETIGTIFFDQNEDKYIVSFSNAFKDSYKFDFLLIHQGLLDKIYEHFNIKNNMNKKKRFTYDFYSQLSVLTPLLIKEGEGQEESYLPQFIIHSGRSKPEKNDMPQKQPFIQFAALENAVKDCKYTLMELLYSAYYEDNSDNN